MKLKSWEVGAALVGLAFALIFLFSNVWGIGVGLLCADALWLLTRVEIVEKTGAPGRYATLRGRLGLAKLVLLIGVYSAVIYGSVIAQRDASGLRVGVLASFALAGLAFMLLGELKRSGDDTINWLIGARAERKVGAELDRLSESGWLVLHGYKRDWGGDIDHIVCGPGGIFMVETKSYEFRRSDLRRAAWNAAWMKERLAVQWVTGVLCVNEDRPATLDGKIWVVGHSQLVPWLEKQRNAKHATIYTWPAELRPKTPKGTRASLHAKCAVADGQRLLVSSANLTEFALTLNIELGLLVEGDDAPERVLTHLESLIDEGVLKPVA